MNEKEREEPVEVTELFDFSTFIYYIHPPTTHAKGKLFNCQPQIMGRTGLRSEAYACVFRGDVYWHLENQFLLNHHLLTNLYEFNFVGFLYYVAHK